MGLLDGNLDPQTAGALALAGGLLSPGSFGQGLSRGIAGQQEVAQNAQKIQLMQAQQAQMQQQMLMEKLKFAQDTNVYNQQSPIMAEMARRLRVRLGLDPSDGATGAAPQTPQPSVMAGADSQPPMMSSNPTMGGTAPQAPQTPQAPQGGSIYPGMSDDMAMALWGSPGGPGKIPDALIKYNEPTPEQKNAAVMGYTPQMQLRARLAADAKAGEVERRGGNQFANFYTGASGMVPKLPENANPVGPVASNGALPGGVSPVPGAIPVVGATAGSIAGAKQDEDIKTVPGPNGPITARGKTLLPRGVVPSDTLSSLQEQLQQVESNGGNPINPADQPAIDREAAKVKAKIAALGGAPALNTSGAVIAGQSTTDKAIAKSGADIIGAAPQIVAQSKSAITGLETALSQLEAGTPSGPGASRAVSALALLNNLHVPLMKGDVDGYQTLQKYLQNSLNTAVQGTSASGSDARFESFMHGQPNAETMNPTALKGAIRYVLSQHDAAIARNTMLPQAYQDAQASGAPNPTIAAQQKWAQAYKPDFFSFNRMSPEDQAAFLKSSTVKSKYGSPTSFAKQYNDYAATTGWVH